MLQDIVNSKRSFTLFQDIKILSERISHLKGAFWEKWLMIDDKAKIATHVLDALPPILNSGIKAMRNFLIQVKVINVMV
jgi:hypothetical protein